MGRGKRHRVKAEESNGDRSGEGERAMGGPDNVWKHHSGDHEEVCTHTQDRQNSRHEQSNKVWVLWTQMWSQVCEWHGQRKPEKGWGQGTVWSVCTARQCTDISGLTTHDSAEL